MDDGGITLTGLTIGGAALTTIGGLAGAWLKARYSRARIEPQPLEVKQSPEIAPKVENDKDHDNIFWRLTEHDKAIAALQEGAANTKEQLGRMDKKLDILIGRKD